MYRLLKYKKYYKLAFIVLAVIICGIIYLVQRISQMSEKGSITLKNTSVSTQTDTDVQNRTEAVTNSTERQNVQSSQSTELENLLYIYVCGCVNTPGVFKCQEGSRVYELIEQAGGFSADADETGLNLVDVVKDGQKLYVPSKEEKTVAEGGGTTTEQKKPLLNINKATKEQLMTLPGIGESKANDIISYRTTNGAFKSTEDIMNVAGIKDAAYTKIKDYICVN